MCLEAEVTSSEPVPVGALGGGGGGASGFSRSSFEKNLILCSREGEWTVNASLLTWETKEHTHNT